MGAAFRMPDCEQAGITNRGAGKPTAFPQRIACRVRLPASPFGLHRAESTESMPGPPDQMSVSKPINHNKLQRRTNHNNKSRMQLRAVQIGSKCGGL
jgi:hypothetical protein